MMPTTLEFQSGLQARTAEILAMTVQTKRLLAEAAEALRLVRRAAAELQAVSRRPRAATGALPKHLSDRFAVRNGAGEDWGAMTEFTQGGAQTFWLFGFQAALEADGSFSLPSGERC